MNKVQFITITDEHHGQRLDNFLLRILKGVPKSHIYRLIRKGEVRINKKRCDAKDRLEAGDELRVPPVKMSETKEKPTALTASQQALIDRIILFENDDFIVINKPEGLAVHGGSNIKMGLIEMLRLYKPHYQKTELAHRLDRDTSGCILIAKKMASLRVLHDLIRNGHIKKVYTALVKGYWPAKLRFVDASLRKQVLQSGERMVKVDEEEGKASSTTFRVLQRFDDTTLISAELHTGRTHQIRVHTQCSGHPIVGDEKYGDDEFNKIIRKKGVKRMCLHATHIELTWPVDGKKYSFEAPLPDNFLPENIG